MLHSSAPYPRLERARMETCRSDRGTHRNEGGIMKRWLALPAAAALLGARAASGDEGVRGGVGAFYGLSAPVLQDVDASSFSPGDALGETGSEWGVRVPIKVIPV